MSTQAFDTMMGAIWLVCLLALIGIHAVPPTVRYVRAWLYVRFFLRYEMPGCAVEAKVREGQA